jgi:lipopolysaccharide transport system permease protein
MKTAAPVAIQITSRGCLFPNLAEAWHKWPLAWLLARRNVKVRFTQTILGRTWIIIQPLALTGVFSLVFGAFLSLPSAGMPYVVFAFAGTALWTLIQRALTDTGTSLSNAAGLVSKVYFPRILIPLSTIFTAAIDFLPVYICLLVVVGLYGVFPGWPIVLSPLVTLLVLVAVFAFGLWVAALDSLYRDIRFFVPYGLQLLFYISPVVYSADAVPGRLQQLYALNPLVTALELFRWTMIAGAPPPSQWQIAAFIVLTLLLLLGGLIAFARVERVAVDRI